LQTESISEQMKR